MSMSGAALASEIRVAMSFPIPNSTQLTAWASAVVTEITANAIVNHSVVTGLCPASGGPLTSGAASGGIITGLSGPRLALAVRSAAGYGTVTSQLTAYCAQICSHVMGGTVTFFTGNIVGTCTNTALSPGTLSVGAGSNGVIVGLSGPTLASAIHTAVGYSGGVSSALTTFCTAIVAHITSNAQCAYISGRVTGTCPAGGGLLSGGAAVNGSVS